MSVSHAHIPCAKKTPNGCIVGHEGDAAHMAMDILLNGTTTDQLETQHTSRVPGGPPAQRRRIALLIGAMALLGLCVFFHIYRLAQTPGWDPQEGYNLDLAWNLLHGRLRLFALTNAFAQHPPLFYLQLALMIRLVGYNILAIRALVALYAVLTCAMILVVARRLLGIGPALWAAAVYTLAPIALANTRWGYSYAQLSFVGLVCLWAAWRYHETPTWRWLTLAAVLGGLCVLSDYEGVAWVVFVSLVALRRSSWRDGVRALLIGVATPLVGLLICLLAAPAVFLADLSDTFGRAAGGNIIVQFVELLLNYYHFLSYDPWILLGVVGMFLIPHSRARAFLLGAVATLTVVALKARVLGASFHTAEPLLPLLAIGAGMAFDLALRSLYAWTLHWLGRDAKGVNLTVPRVVTGQSRYMSLLLSPRIARGVAALIVFWVIVSPIGMAGASDLVGLSGSLPTRQDALLVNPPDAQAVARYILSHAHSGDLVLASPAIAWMFDAPEDASGNATGIQGADIVQTVAQSGQAAAFYPACLPATRWVYSVSLTSARYVVVDDLVRQLATPDQLPALTPIVERAERWPIVFSAGHITVYERPSSP